MISTQKLLLVVIIMNLIFSFCTEQGQTSFDNKIQQITTGTQEASTGQQATGIDLTNQQQKLAGNSVGMGISWWNVFMGGIMPLTTLFTAWDVYANSSLGAVMVGILFIVAVMNTMLYLEIYLVIMNKKTT